MKLLREFINELLSSPKDDADLTQRFDAFMSEYESMTEYAPLGVYGDRFWFMGEIDDKYCLVVTNLRVFDGAIHFGSIQTVPPDLCEKRGFASTVMNQIVALADKHRVPITLDPHPFGQKSITKKGLTAWYKRAGFEKKRGTYGMMIRRPR